MREVRGRDEGRRIHLRQTTEDGSKIVYNENNQLGAHAPSRRQTTMRNGGSGPSEGTEDGVAVGREGAI